MQIWFQIQIQIKDFYRLDLIKRLFVDRSETDATKTSYIFNKPAVTAFNLINSDWNATSGVAVILNKPLLSGALPTGPQGIQGIQGAQC